MFAERAWPKSSGALPLKRMTRTTRYPLPSEPFLHTFATADQQHTSGVPSHSNKVTYEFFQVTYIQIHNKQKIKSNPILLYPNYGKQFF